MEQQIRFCKTSDGVRIAYASTGQGPPLVRVLGWLTHLEYEWENPRWRRIWGGTASRFTFARYDGRGMGLSDREVSDFSHDASVRDLEAVVDALGHEKVALYGISQGGPVAIIYAVRHPERVSHLLVYGSFARFPFSTEQYETMEALVRQGWGSDVPAHRQFFTGLFVPDGDMEAIQAFNEMQRVSASADSIVAMFGQNRGLDVTHLLPKVTVPTLVVHRRGDAIVPFEFGRELAAGIPGAHFLPLDGRNHALLSDIDVPVMALVAKCVDEFVGGGEEAATGAEVPEPGAFRTVLFTDVEGSTSLTQRLGDARARDLLRTHERIVRDALRSHQGSEVKTMGDGFMASFSSATRALECAISMQRAFAEHNEAAEEPIRVRVGLNAGEPIAEDEDLFGTAVIEAARIAGLAEGGEILVANVVRELAKGKGFLFSDRGDTSLRGFEDPVRLFQLRWREDE